MPRLNVMTSRSDQSMGAAVRHMLGDFRVALVDKIHGKHVQYFENMRKVSDVGYPRGDCQPLLGGMGN